MRIQYTGSFRRALFVSLLLLSVQRGPRFLVVYRYLYGTTVQVERECEMRANFEKSIFFDDRQ